MDFYSWNCLNGGRKLEPTLIDAAYFSGFAGFKNPMAEKVCDMFGYSNNPKGISITNLTKAPIPETYGTFKISNLNFIPPLVPNARCIIGIVTLGKTMVLNMQYPDGENRRSEEILFLEAVKQLKSLE